MIGTTIAAKNYTAHGRMILMSGSAGGVGTSTPWPNSTLTAINSLDSLQTFIGWFFPGGAADPAACRALAAYISWQPYSNNWWNRKWLNEQGKAMDKYYRDNSTAKALGKNNQRVIIMHGILDRVVPIRNAMKLGQLFHGSWVMQIADAGHAVVFTALDAIIFVALDFLRYSHGECEGRRWCCRA